MAIPRIPPAATSPRIDGGHTLRHMNEDATPIKPRGTQVTVGDLTFDAVIAGPDDGPPVVLLHGFPQTSRSWRMQLEALAGAGFRAVAFDQRGYSPGARPRSDEAYQIGHLADDVLGVASALGFDWFHVVGHDWGGFIAWWLGARHADHVRSVVAVSTPHPKAFGRALRFPEQRLRSFYFPLFRSPQAAEALTARGALGLRAVFALSGLPNALAQPYINRTNADPGMIDAALAWYRTNTGRELPHLGGTGTVAVPTLYVWSSRDSALGPYAAHLTGRYVSGPYRFEALASVSHWIPEMAPDTLNRLLLEHLEGASG
jgi:pimeloyl-ACP methyl ester carboxylesterase